MLILYIVNKLLTLLNTDFKIDFVFTHYNEIIFFTHFIDLIFHKNSSIKRMSTSSEYMGKFGLYILEKKMIISALQDSLDKSNFDFCTVYTDKNNINAYTNIANKIIESSINLFEISDMNYIEKNLLNREFKVDSNRISIYYDFHPNYLLMNEPLAKQVIFQSYDNIEHSNEIYKYYKLYRLSLLKSLNYGTNIHFFSLSIIIENLNKSNIDFGLRGSTYYPYLRFTNKQYRKFLKDIIYTLNTYKRFNVSLDCNVFPYWNRDTIRFYLHSSYKMFIFDNSNSSIFYCCIDRHLINSVSNILEQNFFLSNANFNYKNEIIKILEL